MKKRVLSGMQPSGRLHLGNLFGALENWKKLQDEYDSYFFVADWHALSTGYEDTGSIRRYAFEMVVDWLAAGIDPKKATIFVQSRVKDHAVLHLLLSMITPVSWLERVPTYKDQQTQLSGKDLSTYGFLGYPVLQAADILIYRADFVPVGIDQLPHLELTREIARRFNTVFKTTLFPEPAHLLTPFPKLTGLDGRKMSKSYQNAIYLSDSEKEVWEKLRTMVTDPARQRRTDAGNPDVCPAFDLHKVFTQKGKLPEIDQGCRMAGIGCIDCKKILNESLKGVLDPIREEREKLIGQKDKINAIMETGSQSASKEADKTLELVKEAMKI
ncbi:MAG: tryptophan--tRNA ligase [Nitrospirae bacterium]|nr:tryptophan--tRNA ligase [Nitrospirota bacterium]